jgi:hypothetical protein
MAEFPIAANDRRIQYTASAAQTVFPYDYPIFADTELQVFRTRSGVTTTLTLSSDYTVSGAGAQNGGNVTLTAGAALNDVITIKGAMPIARTSDYQEGGDFRAVTVNRDFDRLVIMMQEQVGGLARVLRQPDEDSANLATLAAASARANKFLSFDSNGQPVMAAGTSANLGPVSGFVNTLLDDADADTFLATLGFSALMRALRDDTDGAGALVALGVAEMLRGQLVGMTLVNNAGDPVNDMDIQPGWCVSENTPRKLLALAATLTKRLDANWAGGHNQGGLDTGAIANVTYHLHVIGKHGLAPTQRQRAANVVTLTFGAAHGLAVGQTIIVSGVGGGYDAVVAIASVPLATTLTYANTGANDGPVAVSGADVSACDWLFSASATSPTMPGGWTSRRRVGSLVRVGGNIRRAVQDGDNFVFTGGGTLEVNATNPGAAAVTRTLSAIPTGIVVRAKLAVTLDAITQTFMDVLLTSLDQDDVAVSASNNTALITDAVGNDSQVAVVAECKTNTSAQIRSRSSSTGAFDVLRIASLGYIDDRGRNA